jgi:hypothetical protein
MAERKLVVVLVDSSQALDRSRVGCRISYGQSIDAATVNAFVSSEELQQVFRHPARISKQPCATEDVIDNRWLRDQSIPGIAWEQNTNRH